MVFMFQNNNVNSSGRIIENASIIKDKAWGSIDNILTAIVEQLPYIAAGIIVMVFFLIISKIVKKIFWATSEKTKLDYRLRILTSRLIGLGIVVLGFFFGSNNNHSII